MTKLLEKGIEAIRDLPADRQDLAGELLLTLAAGTAEFGSTAAQIEDLKLSVAQADRGEFSTDQEVADTWTKFGL
jgi:hypothetical protein